MTKTRPNAPLRCHLLMGPPGSGKSRLANELTALISTPDKPAPLVLSTETCRRELREPETPTDVDLPASEAQLKNLLRQAVASGQPVIVDGTHARRSSRLALIQALDLPAPVEWIGWKLTTPLETCLSWNQKRGKLAIPEDVLSTYHKAFNSPKEFPPSRYEGFTVLVLIDPSEYEEEEFGQVVAAKLNGLDLSISQARKNPNWPRAEDLHGYSSLLDFERLMHLLQLLSEGRGPTVAEAAQILEERHGRCYGDRRSIESDLTWLEANGFCSAMPVYTPITLPDCRVAELHKGAWCAYGKRESFLKLITFIRYLLHHPFENPSEDSGVAQTTSKPAEPNQKLNQKTRPKSDQITKDKPKKLYEHLANQLALQYPMLFSLRGVADQLHNAVTDVIHPYNLSIGHARKGFAIGTAILTGPEVIEMHKIVLDAITRKNDPSPAGIELYKKLRDHLPRAGFAVDEQLAVRAIANRSIVDPQLVAVTSLTKHAKKLEQAIVHREQIMIAKLIHAGRFEDIHPNQGTTEERGPWKVWPLQLLFHNIAWYLAYEKEPEPGQNLGLIKVDRLDWLEWSKTPSDLKSPRDFKTQEISIMRLRRLIERSGGIHFGRDAKLQGVIGGSSAKAALEKMKTLRFHCNAQVFPFFTAGSARFPAGQMRLSKRRSDDPWHHRPNASWLHQLAPNSSDNDHPYPVVIKLPPWTLKEDYDFRRWLFGFGNSIYIEKPEELRLMQINLANGLIQMTSKKAEAASEAKLKVWEGK